MRVRERKERSPKDKIKQLELAQTLSNNSRRWGEIDPIEKKWSALMGSIRKRPASHVR